MTQIIHAFLTKVQVPTPFLKIDPDCLHTCSMRPCQAVDECGSGVFSAEIFGSPKTQISQKIY